jgi:hypothetical protein
MLAEEKTLDGAQRFRSAVEQLYSHLCETSPITVNSHGGRTPTLTPDATFVGYKLGEVENALQKYSREPDRLFPILTGIDRDITTTLGL